MSIDDHALADWSALYDEHRRSERSKLDDPERPVITVKESELVLLRMIRAHPDQQILEQDLKDLLMSLFWKGYDTKLTVEE